ncbi:hypothetical protein AYO49_00245 [Verrucomicrobiaceae bacterium SCGC AG-212-N21]|nr:hypothetical protein AYO49_00245 [Verrucomicrobiaceae bacterium SCGC AG-212-N21]
MHATMKHRTENADLSGAEYVDVNLGGAQFRDVNLAGALFEDVNLKGTRFEDVALAGSVIRNADCSHVTIEDACYEGMKIDGILVTDLLQAYRDRV